MVNGRETLDVGNQTKLAVVYRYRYYFLARRLPPVRARIRNSQGLIEPF